jgi:hypothetical protein
MSDRNGAMAGGVAQAVEDLPSKLHSSSEPQSSYL